MVRVYTDIFEGFQFRAPTYLDGHFEPHVFDLVKWEEHDPYEVLDLETGKKKISTNNCFSIGRLIWNPKEECFKFESCGMRYFKYRKDGLEDFILEFSLIMEKQLTKE